MPSLMQATGTLAGQAGWRRALAIGASYALLSYVCLSFSRFGAPVESIWLSNALLVAGLASTPRAGWAAMVVCAAIGHQAAHLAAGDAPAFSAAFLVGDMFEAVFCAFLLKPRTLAFASRADVFRFLLVCGLAGPLLSACIAAAGSWLIGRQMALQDFAVWFGADSLGLIVLLPIFYGFGLGRWRGLSRKPARLALALLAVAGFSVLSAYFIETPTLRLLLLPVFVVIAFELGVAGSQICLAMLMTTWTILTIAGRPPTPWVELSQRDYMLVTQVFLAVFSATILPLAVALEEKQRLNDTLAGALAETREAWGAIIGAEARYRIVVDNVSETVMRVSPQGLILFASEACGALLREHGLEGADLFDLIHPDDVAREREHFGHCIEAGLVNIANRWGWRLQGEGGVWTPIDARVTLVAPGGPGEREFVVVLRPLE
jgi:integral membrane sensor domain MASE1